MSIENTKHTKNWKTIPKKCKNCSKAVYVKEDDNKIFYQCSLFGSFKRNCNLEIIEKYLPKPEEITGE